MDANNTNMTVENGIVKGYQGSEMQLTIPEGVTAIGAEAFLKCKSLKSVTFPASVVEIGSSAFRGCTSLDTVKLNEGLQRIGDKAFFACRIQSVAIPDSVSYIGKQAFVAPPNGDLTIHCTRGSFAEQYAKQNGLIYATRPALGFDHLGEDCDKILKHAYQAAITNDEKTVFIPDGIEIVRSGFGRDQQIQRVVLPQSVRQIGVGAFSDCRNLKQINFPEGLTSIDWHAFYNCGLKEVILPDTLEFIEDEAFLECSIERLKLPNGLKHIGADAFAGLSVQELILPESLLEIGVSAFRSCWRLERVVLPENLQYLGDRAFCACDHLQSVRIPGKGLKIGNRVFEFTRSVKVTIEHCPDAIDPECFDGAYDITIVTSDKELLKLLSGFNNLQVLNNS